MRLTALIALASICLWACSSASEPGEGSAPQAEVSTQGEETHSGGSSDVAEGGALPDSFDAHSSDASDVLSGEPSDLGEVEPQDVQESPSDIARSDFDTLEEVIEPSDAQVTRPGEDVSASADGVVSDAQDAEDGAPSDVLSSEDATEGEVLQGDVEAPTDTQEPSLDGLIEDADSLSGSPDSSDAFADAGDVDTSLDAEAQDADALEEVDAEPPPPPKPLYLLSVNNAQKTLEKIDVETGEGTDVCQLPPTSNYPSLTFSRDNILFASRQGQYLDAIDPCTCEVSPVGSYNGFTGVNGITSDFGLNLFGVSHVQDVLLTINSQTGAGTSVGPLGVNFGYTGATWSDSEAIVYAIDASSDGLFKIEPSTGTATFVAPLSLPMGTVGIEMHPENGVLYACSDPAHLLSIDLITGEVTDIGDMGQNTACNNLAAPWKEVPCLDEL